MSVGTMGPTAPVRLVPFSAILRLCAQTHWAIPMGIDGASREVIVFQTWHSVGKGTFGQLTGKEARETTQGQSGYGEIW